MRSRSIKVALASAFMLTSPLLTFAGGQPAKVRMLSKSEMQDRTGITQAVQQGKGTGMTRNQVIRANAYRSQTAEESPARRDGPNWGDTAFRK